MKIKYVFKGIRIGKIVEITSDDGVSPNGGYTQSYADRVGKDYENGRAQELFGDKDVWKWQKSEYVNRPGYFYWN